MKPGKLYIKIFISFVIVLIITEIVIFGLFVFTAGRSARSRIERYVNAQSTVVRQYVETTIRSEPLIGLSENRSLIRLIHDLGNIYQAKVWLTGTDGKSIIQSFEGSIPEDTSKFHQKHTRKPTDNGSYHSMRRGFVHYIRMPVEFQKGAGELT
ncbi:MAG: hypothetical protein KJ573_07280 [Proteobacteria bacterium]|nr:hypothetical protein [Pseudomonadota bacterium]